MPTKPASTTLNATTPQILNAVRNSASPAYARAVPIATNDNVREIGTAILSSPIYTNEFLSALINRIGAVIVSSRMYKNPWAVFKKGRLEFGESIEEIFVSIAKANVYDIDQSETEVFKRETPGVESAFHILNYRTFYKTTIMEEQLRQAFLSMNGVTDMIGRIVDSMYSAAEYDEFQMMKYCVARNLIEGKLYPVAIDNPQATGFTEEMASKSGAKKFKAVSNQLQFMSDKYNFAGVKTTTPVYDQYLIVTADFDAKMDVDVLASAFNMDKAEFMGHRVLIDSFSDLDFTRLNELLGDTPGYYALDDLMMQASLNSVKAVLVDSDWFMIFDNTEKFTEIYNSQGLYWNYFYHVWKTFSVSPFCNAVAFTTIGATTDINLTVEPATATLNAGETIQLTAKATGGDYLSYDRVKWSVDPTKGSVDYKGNVTIKKGVTGTVTVTATTISTELNPTPTSASCTITVK